jgi:hypothetical protein
LSGAVFRGPLDFRDARGMHPPLRQHPLGDADVPVRSRSAGPLWACRLARPEGAFRALTALETP